jgi:hypothetical protein
LRSCNLSEMPTWHCSLFFTSLGLEMKSSCINFCFYRFLIERISQICNRWIVVRITARSSKRSNIVYVYTCMQSLISLRHGQSVSLCQNSKCAYAVMWKCCSHNSCIACWSGMLCLSLIMQAKLSFPVPGLKITYLFILSYRSHTSYPLCHQFYPFLWRKQRNDCLRDIWPGFGSQQRQ